MTSRTWFATASYSVLFVSLPAALHAQAQPLQFRSDLQVRDLDGKTATGKLYVGAAKQRMEFGGGAALQATIADPQNGTQNTIASAQRKYTEMPLGESGGPVRIPKLAAVDPANPCASGELSDCMRLGAEMLNGYPTQKWQYTNVDGERVTAWIATKLRFPIKTVADSGATNEVRNVVEGAQAADLFLIPSGYAQVDDLGGGGNVIANALAQAQAAVRAQGNATAASNNAPPKAAPPRPGSSPSIWEAGPGYVMNLSVTMKAAKENGPTNARERSTITLRYSVSVPMNYGTPAVPPNVGPQWSTLNLPGSGNAAVEARPITMALEWEEQTDSHFVAGCQGIEADTSDTTKVVKGKAAGTSSVAKPAPGSYPQALMQINPALTAFSFVGGVSFGHQADVVSTTKRVDHCKGDLVTNETKTAKAPIPGQNAVDIKNVPLPPTPAGLKGTRSIPWRFNNWNEPATVVWNIVPVPR
jgi:hypothetical protein